MLEISRLAVVESSIVGQRVLIVRVRLGRILSGDFCLRVFNVDMVIVARIVVTQDEKQRTLVRREIQLEKILKTKFTHVMILITRLVIM